MNPFIKFWTGPRIRGRYSKKKRQRIKSERNFANTPWQKAINSKPILVDLIGKSSGLGYSPMIHVIQLGVE